MPEQEESGFKVTDRRKYNPDGSPREAGELAVSQERSHRKLQIGKPKTMSVIPGWATKNRPGAPSGTQPEQNPERKPQPKPWPLDRRLSNASRPRNRQQRVTPKRLTIRRACAVVAVTRSLVSRSCEYACSRSRDAHGVDSKPRRGPPPPDLEAARHLIDMLGILRPTRGNLTVRTTCSRTCLADLRCVVAISKRR